MSCEREGGTRLIHSSMVVHKPWLPVDLRLPAGPQASLGILAFEAAAAMSKLLSLHRSLSDQELSRLRSDAMRSPGVAYLNSTDQAFLLRLACAELVVSLDAAAAAVARLGLRCGLDFGGVYACLKSGAHDARLDLLVAKGLRVKAKKMERLVAATAKLCSEMEALDELESTERKMNVRGWNRLSGPIPQNPQAAAAAAAAAAAQQQQAGDPPQGGVPVEPELREGHRPHGVRRLRGVRPNLRHLRPVRGRPPAAAAGGHHGQRPDPAVEAAAPAVGEGEGIVESDHASRRPVPRPPADEQLVPDHRRASSWTRRTAPSAARGWTSSTRA